MPWYLWELLLYPRETCYSPLAMTIAWGPLYPMKVNCLTKIIMGRYRLLMYEHAVQAEL